MTWPIRARAPGCRSNGCQISDRCSEATPPSSEPAAYGNWKSAGITPITVTGWPSSVSIRPTTAGSAASRRRQNSSLTTATPAGSPAA
jgi:hypothetical protein